MSERCPHCLASLEQPPVVVLPRGSVLLKPGRGREVLFTNSTARPLRVTAEVHWESVQTCMIVREVEP